MIPRKRLLLFTVPLVFVVLHSFGKLWTLELPLSESRGLHDIYYLQKQTRKQLADFIKASNDLCLDLEERNHSPHKPLRVSYQLNCEGLYYGDVGGTGNWLLFLYGIRQVAHLLGQVQLEIKCSDAVKNRRHLILPWIMGTWAARPTMDLDWSACDITWKDIFLKHAIFEDPISEDVKYELRRMAIAMVGVPNENHPARYFEIDPAREERLQVPMPSSPFYLNLELDDVAIHFRCGDILERRPHEEYGYANFHSLSNLISNTTTSIGIVTQPFRGQKRVKDGRNQGRCRILVGALQSFLQQRFPRAIITVRNDPSETLTLAFTRFIMAKQAIAASTSTFVFLPLRATFGTAHEITKKVSSVQIFDLWKKKNGQDQILNLLTSKEAS